MSIPLTFNGQSYVIPSTNEVGWGSNLDDYLVAIAAGALQKTGGNFTLAADVDFGGAFGIKSVYVKSRTANPASTGILRLANGDLIEWRNGTNTGDIGLTVNSSNQLVFDGTPLQQVSLTSAHILVGNGSNIATDVPMSGDIGIDNTGLTAIQPNVIVDNDISNSAAIAYSKLNLSLSIVNSDIAVSAAIALSKLASLTASRVLVSDGSGVISASTVTTTTLGFLDATSSIQTQLTNLDQLASYRRSNLIWASVTEVDIENNTGMANQTTVIFPDATFRTVTEDTSITSQYRRFNITETAEFTSGTENSGLRSGLSEASNTWYALYAVKSQINSANFVLVGDTTLPIQTNYSTLNTRYGTNSWVYLGLIRNGDNVAAPSDLIIFHQCNNHTTITSGFTNAGSGLLGFGILFVNSTLTLAGYSPTQGTGATDEPNNLISVDWYVSAGTAGVTQYTIGNGGVGSVLKTGAPSGSALVDQVLSVPVQIGIGYLDGSSNTKYINLFGWTDGLLS